MEKAKRYLIFLIGLFINSMGVSLITKASLGTSPILSIPYVLSLNFPMTLGEFTILFSILLIAVQLLILKKNFRPEHWLQIPMLQIPISVAFGYFIDLTMVMFGFIQPAGYGENLIYLLVGCVVLGFGVYTEVLADVAMLPGESFVRAVSSTWNTGRVHDGDCRRPGPDLFPPPGRRAGGNGNCRPSGGIPGPDVREKTGIFEKAAAGVKRQKAQKPE